MAFCSYCGQTLTPGARFCAACGSPVTAEALAPAVETAPVAAAPVVNYSSVPEYSIVLYSIGTCARSYADDLLEDILGYTKSEAKQILAAVPTQIAQALTMEQAQYIAQALTEYGMQVVVLKGQTEIDLSGYATRSVFNSDGSFISAALTALATLGLANRLTRFQRVSKPSLLERIFAPLYRWTQPRHVTRAPRRTVITRAPEPAPRRASMTRKLEQPRRTGDVIRDVSIDRSNRGGIRTLGPKNGRSTGGAPTTGTRSPSGGHGGSRGPGGRR